MQNRFRKQKSTAVSQLAEASTAQIPPKPPVWIWLMTGCVWTAMLLAPGAAGFWAVMDLLALPGLPQCWAPAWAENSAANRLYCAKEAAERQTAESWQTAIRLANAIPQDDPLRSEADRLIEKWGQQMLEVGEAAFQNGELEQAIEIARQIPDGKLSQERIRQWETVWNQAEDLYRDAEAAIEQQHWYDVLSAARSLLAVDNRYWATVQHQELMRRLQLAKDSQTKQRQQSPIAKPARPLDAADDLFAQLEQDDRAEAAAHLAKARRLAQSGSPTGLRAALDEAGHIFYGDPGYEEAQQAISLWRRQIELAEDGPLLEQAIALASKDDVASLRAAIDEANHIGWGRALYEQAQTQIDQWRDRVYALEAQARAEQLDRLGIDNPPPLRPVSAPPESSPAPGELTEDRSAFPAALPRLPASSP